MINNLFLSYTTVNSTVYLVIRQPYTNYILDADLLTFTDDDSNPYIEVPEDGVSLGTYWVNLSDVIFDDNQYIVTFYKQVASVQNPSSDTLIDSYNFLVVNGQIQVK